MAQQTFTVALVRAPASGATVTVTLSVDPSDIGITASFSSSSTVTRWAGGRRLDGFAGTRSLDAHLSRFAPHLRRSATFTSSDTSAKTVYVTFNMDSSVAQRPLWSSSGATGSTSTVSTDRARQMGDPVNFVVIQTQVTSGTDDFLNKGIYAVSLLDKREPYGDERGEHRVASERGPRAGDAVGAEATFAAPRSQTTRT